MKKYRVVYTATFECDVVLPDGCEDEASLADATSDIDIPEGGKNGSVYCENTFDIIEIHNPEDE